jgi:DNA-binding MarR family transcriptional regulator
MPSDHASNRACTCFVVRRAARHLTQAYDRYLAPTGLRTTQYSLLSTLRRTGPRSIQSLAGEMGLDRTTLGRNLRPLERDGLVSIGVDPLDRRGRALAISEAGEVKLEEARHCWEAAQARFVDTYGEAETQALHATLDGLVRLELGAG